MTMFDHPIYDLIARNRQAISKRVRLDNGQPLPADLDLGTFERTLDNSFTEHFQYQQLQSQGFAMGKIDLTTATVVYAALGEVPASNGWAEDTDLATKLVVTQVLHTLAQRMTA